MSISKSIIVCDYSSTLSVKRYYHFSQTRRLHSTTFVLHSKGLPSLTVSHKKPHAKRQRFIVNSAVQPGVPPPSGPPFDFLKWMVGVMAFVLPIFTGKWGSFLRLKNEVDTTVQSIEDVVEAIEKVADEIDKAAEKISKDLPEGGTLRRAADFVEHAAHIVSKDAHLLDNFIDTVQEAEQKVEEYVEAIAEEAIHGHRHPKLEESGGADGLAKEITAEAHEPIADIVEVHMRAEEEEAHEPSREAHGKERQS